MSEDTVRMGVLKPEYIQRAKNLAYDLNVHADTSSRFESAARHPSSAGPRRKEFMAQAAAHNEKAFQAGNQIMAMGIKPKGSFTRRGEFHSAAFARHN